MFRPLFPRHGPNFSLGQQRSYAIMNRAKKQAGILDLIQPKQPTKLESSHSNKNNTNTILYSKPVDRSIVNDKTSSKKRRNVNNDHRPRRHEQQGHSYNQRNRQQQEQQLSSVRYQHPLKSQQQQLSSDPLKSQQKPSSSVRYQHPLRSQQQQQSTANEYDRWAETPLQVIGQTSGAELNTTWTSHSSRTMEGVDQNISSPKSRVLDQFKRMSEQKVAGMAERLAAPVKAFAQPENPHLIKVAVIGAPNAGKSTLVNKMVGEDVSIVSSKSHTTRERILAILSEDNHQVIFLDTPGIISPKSKENMNRSITTSSWRSLDEADHVLIMMDSVYAGTKESQMVQEFMMDRLSSLTIPATLIFNKMDVTSVNQKEVLERISDEFKKAYPSIKNVLYISALEEDGIDGVKDILFTSSKAQAWLYPPDQKLEMSALKRVEELIRVQFFKRLHRYIPYMLKQENMGWTELKNGGLRIEQNVYVERDSQHKIVVGANGMIINRVIEDARQEISKAFKRPIQLFIQVKTRKE
ncbi:P-loop containing nucleoside triphosphate hydrolase protein [Halteromyces radiatus]|uniref:P-loop containing nucleoside triphosphate hydrolase protein n=1 Tax=Halteromyces radiatus TaxID=101107 RepID=UPI00221F9DAF|nr:P-loop containing nucleoside triphosphate hydrolase protein [Halteromyces radiatus]KAI8099029.1 P-loop containing nucleoside triphosphate hydrolase protein [Halteromyces radiatus]